MAVNKKWDKVWKWLDVQNSKAFQPFHAFDKTLYNKSEYFSLNTGNYIFMC